MKNVESAKRCFLNNNEILDVNKKYVIEFYKQIKAEGLSPRRQERYFYAFSPLLKWVDYDLNEADKEKMVQLVGKINDSGKAEETKKGYKVALRRIIKFIREQEGHEFDKYEYPKEVKWIKTTIKYVDEKLPKELLTEEDVLLLAENTNNLRDRAVILTLWESDVRAGELLNLKIKDLTNDSRFGHLDIDGKTGSRRIGIVSCLPAINNWLLEHPNREDPESYLFCGIWGKKRGSKWGYASFNHMLKDTKKRAGIKKPVNPHQFRHSRATFLATRLTEQELKQYGGWKQNSKMVARYVHLSGRDTDHAIKKIYGMAKDEEKESKMKPIDCPRCKTINDPSSRFCSMCSLGLDERTIIDYEEKAKEYLELGELMHSNSDQAMYKQLQILIKKVEALENKNNKA